MIIFNSFASRHALLFLGLCACLVGWYSVCLVVAFFLYFVCYMVYFIYLSFFSVSLCLFLFVPFLIPVFLPAFFCFFVCSSSRLLIG